MTVFLFALYGVLLAGLSCPTITRAEDDPTAGPFPVETLGADGFRVTCYLPEAGGFYQGSRFDWSGMLTDLRCGGHRYFTAWKNPHEPTVNHAAGPAEEFDIAGDGQPAPPGYADAAPGEPFLKIGVGWLRRNPAANYHPFDPYEIIDRGTWRTSRDERSLTFTQELPTRRGYGCLYRKTISIDVRTRTLRISHVLKNTGTKPLDTRSYCHNFLRLDDAPVGTGYQLSLEPDLSADGPSAPTLERRGTVWSPGTGFDTGSPVKFLVSGREKIRMRMSLPATGAAVEIAAEQNVDALQVYADGTAFCPEPFVFLHLAPGQEATWTWRYVFQP